RPLRGRDEHRFDFSFSGLKTAVLNLTRKLQEAGVDIESPAVTADIAASFQQAAIDVLVEKTVDAAINAGARQICVCGGVSANALLRAAMQARCDEAGLLLTIPPLFLCTDNAAMIGAAAHFRWRTQPTKTDDLSLDVFANLPLPEAT
ncbi:MAG: tRNA (adenosine(37)-N6)-threonylcarbamoyltransferase complex transferase subunit TsaD, partial [Caldilineaceae bacterium]|nr:tRNA (adenosine(37)-N6)-threonylcarbamoyltransferase complex transferase subunit TsaD [Caldilineaceae bacterium]